MTRMTDGLTWLQKWYSEHCDGKWEHDFGITMETIDNPGWSLTVCVEGTELASAIFEPVKTERSEMDWVQCRVTERETRPSTLAPSRNYRRFEGFGGATNLSEIIGIFRTWVEAKR